MASGTKQHFGMTVMSSNKEEDGFTADFANTKRKGGVAAPAVAAINGKIGNKALFNSYEEDNNRNPLGEADVRGLPPPSIALKVVDVYADGFISKDKGVGLFVDLGVDAIKLESKLVNFGLGARCDTGFNVGRQGGRICFLGCGGEVIFGPKPAPVEKKTPILDTLTCARKKEPDPTELAVKAKEAALAEKTNRFGNVMFRGFAVQWWFFKLKVMLPGADFDPSKDELEFAAAAAAAAANSFLVPNPRQSRRKRPLSKS